MEFALRRFEAREQIENIVYAYAEALDSGDLEKFANIFESGSLVIHPSGVIITGKNANFQAVKNVVIYYDEKGNGVDEWMPNKQYTPRTHHITSNLRFAFDDTLQHASVYSYMTVCQTINEPKVIANGHYHDVFKCQNDKWYLSERNAFLTYLGDTSYHLKK